MPNSARIKRGLLSYRNQKYWSFNSFFRKKKSILAMLNNAFRTTLKKNKDKDVPEYFFIFSLKMKKIDESEATCRQINQVLNNKNVVFHQVYLIDGKVRILPRPVCPHNPDHPTLNVILFSPEEIYGTDYDTTFESASAESIHRVYNAKDVKLIELKRNVPLTTGVRIGNRKNQSQNIPQRYEPVYDEDQQVRETRPAHQPFVVRRSKRRRTN